MSDLSMDELTTLSAYWMDQFLRTQDGPPFVAIVGAERDAIASADGFAETLIGNLAFMTGFLSYPCDAVYVTVCMPVIGEHPAGRDLPEMVRNKLAVVSWSYCVPTGESYSLMRVRDIADDGTDHWEDVLPGPEIDTEFATVRGAANPIHSSDIADMEAIHRRNARDLVMQNNGLGYTVTFLDAQEILDIARTDATMDDE